MSTFSLQFAQLFSKLLIELMKKWLFKTKIGDILLETFSNPVIKQLRLLADGFIDLGLTLLINVYKIQNTLKRFCDENYLLFGMFGALTQKRYFKCLGH